MEINRVLPLLAVLALVSSCVNAPAPPPAAPRPAPTQAPAPVPPPPAPTDWRDAPLTPGDWSYSQTGAGSVAAFGEPGAGPLLFLRCTGGQVLLDRAGAAPGPLPMTLVTTSMTRPLNGVPVPGALPVLRASFAPRDPALDAMAYSRGRIAVEVNGLPTLIVPAWEEIDRVIEDCR